MNESIDLESHEPLLKPAWGLNIKWIHVYHVYTLFHSMPSFFMILFVNSRFQPTETIRCHKMFSNEKTMVVAVAKQIELLKETWKWDTEKKKKRKTKRLNCKRRQNKRTSSSAKRLDSVGTLEICIWIGCKEQQKKKRKERMNILTLASKVTDNWITRVTVAF